MSRSQKRGNSKKSDASKKGADSPADAAIVRKALEMMGVDDYQPAVVSQLLEYVYREIDQSIVGAADMARFAGRPNEVQTADVTALATERANRERERIRWSPESRQATMSLAHQVNMVPLEPIPDDVGVILPPDDQNKLLGWNFEIKYPRAGASSSRPPRPGSAPSHSATSNGHPSGGGGGSGMNGHTDQHNSMMR